MHFPFVFMHIGDKPAAPATPSPTEGAAVEPLARGWGLSPEPGARFHWSARAILGFDHRRQPYLDIVHDRCAVEGAPTSDERSKLTAWLDGLALPYLRANLPDPQDSAVYSFEGDGYRLRYQARGGYLYVSASPADDATGPTPKPPPPPKAKAQKLRRRAR